MSTRISVAVDIIKRVTALDGNFQINHHQCKRLVGLYERAGRFFVQLKELLKDAEYRRVNVQLPSLDVLLSVLQKGQLLVEKYTDKNWLESVLTAGVNQDSFKAIHVELADCIGLIDDAVVQQGLANRMVPLMKVGTVAPLYFLEEEDRVTVFKGDAEMDKKYMLEKIESRKIEVTVGKNTKRSKNKKKSELRSLDMVSEKISEVIVDQHPFTGPQKLPSFLRIEPSGIKKINPIGSGGSAEVFKCNWLNREYAVKIFAQGDVDSLRKEVENLLNLRHPKIVLLEGFSISKEDSRPMVVMELMDCDLHKLIREEHGSIPIPKAIDFIYQIATGMDYLHRNKFFHGDLKGKNVLVRKHPTGQSDRYELKISDFGVSKTMIVDQDYKGNDLDCTSPNNKNVGTTRWRAPEAFDVTEGNLKAYSMKADVYSFAMTCVEILTKDVPYFEVEDLRSLKKYVQAGNRPTLPSDVPGDLRELIARCWHRDPTARPSFSQICKDLQTLEDYSSTASFSVLDRCIIM